MLSQLARVTDTSQMRIEIQNDATGRLAQPLLRELLSVSRVFARAGAADV